MILRINKIVIYWISVFLLGVAMALVFRGGEMLPDQKLTMTRSEADLTNRAIELVLADMDKNVFDTTQSALDALSAELPASVRSAVLTRIGEPSLDALPAVLNEVAGNITIP